MSAIIFSLDDCAAVRLSREDAPELQLLFDRCSDYVELLSGAPPGPTEAEEALTSLPPGKELSDKLNLGIYTDEKRLIGYLDLVRDYPEQHDWWLGLLMLDPAARGSGLGGRLYAETVQWIARQEGRTVWLGVLAENRGAERFWRRQGFEEVRQLPFTADSGKAHTMIVLRHDLISAERE